MTPKEKWLQASLLLSSTAVIVVGILSGTLTESNFQTASVLQYRIGSTVKIEPASNFPDVNISQIEAGQAVADSASCQGKDYITRYSGGSVSKYNEALKSEALCLQGRQKATYINDQISDDKKSLENIDVMIGSVQRLLDSAKQKGLITAVRVVIVPGGFDGAESYPFADNVAMKCLKNKGGEVAFAKIGTGTGSKQIGSVFRVTSPELEAELDKAKKDNAATNKLIQSYKSANKSIPIGAITGIFKDLMTLRGKMATKFIAILPEDLHTYYPDLEATGAYMTLNMDFEVKDGKLVDKTSEIPGAIRFLMSTFGVKGNFVSGIISVDGAKYETYLPIQYMLKDNEKVSNQHLVRLRTLRKSYENRHVQNTAKLKPLIENNYGCPKQ